MPAISVLSSLPPFMGERAGGPPEAPWTKRNAVSWNAEKTPVTDKTAFISASSHIRAKIERFIIMTNIKFIRFS